MATNNACLRGAWYPASNNSLNSTHRESPSNGIIRRVIWLKVSHERRYFRRTTSISAYLAIAR